MSRGRCAPSDQRIFATIGVLPLLFCELQNVVTEHRARSLIARMRIIRSFIGAQRSSSAV
jgi:hypothetical protein